ncbi:hypothetical protein EDB81DRAFT_692838 [Dactylonectria macrodidyma]|uniref:HTH CENPB-type domain-containing protein n=1 Tax=Dactylonectria macrodidyma TaxID=307937 RepID=A0A9P9EI45_9HYPO|nr:hypothetical protein EDB81DRAFT_692838 [Dactylonectria macrodidyma]
MDSSVLSREEMIKQALEKVAEGRSIRSVATDYHFHESLLRARLKGAKNNHQAQEKFQRLSPQQEKLLVNWILEEDLAGRAPSKCSKDEAGYAFSCSDNEGIMSD